MFQEELKEQKILYVKGTIYSKLSSNLELQTNKEKAGCKSIVRNIQK